MTLTERTRKLFGWEDNRRFGVVLAVRHILST